MVVYDMGATVTFDRVFYAQRIIKGQDHVDSIEFWVSDTDPGAASALATVLRRQRLAGCLDINPSESRLEH